MALPSAADAILRRLDARHIGYEVVSHPAILTVAEGERLDLPHLDRIAKTLLIGDRRSSFCVSLPIDRRLDLKALRTKLDCGRLSFRPPEDLQRLLGVCPGAATPLGLCSRPADTVTCVLDTSLRDGLIGIPLLTNTRTIFLPTEGLAALLADDGVTVRWLGL